ncbi:TonB-dependent receptor [Sphingomonas qilianensis]|uniref:TonB-dependent receptor n=1 Tax=Sphingomonas qilianensis TaxID=1736690 RepID=A0ABU9XTV7_9SPHN
MNIRNLLCTGTALTSCFAPAAVFAQSLADAGANSSPVVDDTYSRGAGDIVVTARRRAENVQDVPIAISVVSGATLDEQGAYNISRLAQLAPTLQFYSQNPRNTFINIRGIGAPFGLTNDGFEQGVGIYIDDVYYNRIASATLDFVDVERIEVLRGPQGTLYGKNTTAGAINITTRAPSFDFEGKAEVSLGNLNFKQGKASVSGPLTDKIAARISVTGTSRRGTLYDTAKSAWIQSQDNIGVRGSLLWKATPNFNLTVSGDYNLQDPSCCAFAYGGYGPTQRAANRQYPALISYFPGYQVPSTNPYERVTDADAALAARNEHGGLSARAIWEISDANTLTSITAWRYWDWGPANDRDYTGLPIYTKVNNPTKQSQYTQEFRFSHQGAGYDVVLGLFGFHQKIHTSGVQETGTAASRWLLAPPAGGVCTPTSTALACNPAVLNNVVAINDIRLNNTSLAAFAKLNVEVTDRFTVSPGVRVNYDKKMGLYDSVVTGTASNGTRQIVSAVPGSPSFNDPWTAAQRGIQASQFFEPNFSAWNLSYDLNLRYAVTNDVNVYATYAKSFKTGGINLNGVPADANGAPILAAGTIKPEKVDHFELGFKSQFWDRRATLNVSGFWTEIKDFQANVTNGQFGTIRGYLANAEKIRTRGLEADFTIRPSERFIAHASGAYTDAKYTRFVDAPCPPELSGGTTATGSQVVGPAGVAGSLSPANCDISGQVLPGISKWAASWGAEGNVPSTLFGEEGHFYFGYDASYRSRWSSNPSPSIYTWVNGYSIQNFRAGFRTGRVDTFAWVRNAFDKDYIDLLLAGTGGNTGLIAAQVGDPRTWGGTIRLTF